MRNRVSTKTIFSICCALLAAVPVYAGEAKVAVAASLTFAMNALTQDFQDTAGSEIKTTFGSSRNLMRQIIQGAPFELFLSADQKTIDALVSKSLTLDSGSVYALGSLALFRAHHSKLPLDPRLEGLLRWVHNKKLKRLAIANPETAPYGDLAKQVLNRVGIWDLVDPYLVKGDNAAQTAQFALSSADAGLIPYSIALIPTFAKRGEYVLVEKDYYKPLQHKMVLLKHSGDVAKAFHQFLKGQRARLILASHGFGLPD